MTRLLADDEVAVVDNEALPIEKVLPEAGQGSARPLAAPEALTQHSG